MSWRSWGLLLPKEKKLIVFDSFQPVLETGWRVRSVSVFSCVSYNATESTLVRWGAGSTLLIHDRLMSIAG